MLNGIKAVRNYDCGENSQNREICDRCGTQIRYVFTVTFVDNVTKKFGSECINKILAGDNSLKTLFKKKQKEAIELAQKIEILKRDPDDMPRGPEYFGTGIYTIGDPNAKLVNGAMPSLMWGRVFFHPNIDWHKNQNITHRPKVTGTADSFRQKELNEIKQFLPKMEAQLNAINAFIAKALQKYASLLAHD